jgi:hypothetical protein
MNGIIESIGTIDLPSVGKKKVIAAAVSMSSTKAFSRAGLAHQLEVPTATVSSIHGRRWGGVLELCPGWPDGGGDGQYPPKCGGGQYPPGGGSGGHVRGYPTARDPPQGITGGGPM